MTAQAPSIIIPIGTFTAYAIAQALHEHDQFGATKAFTALSAIGIFVGPVAQLVQMPTNIGSAKGCLDRIQTFLLQEKHNDFRVIPDRDYPVKPSIADDDSGHSLPPRTLVEVRDGSFGWTSDVVTLRHINLDIKSATVVVITGPVGCGKTTLLNSLLGETWKHKGSVKVFGSADMAYCGQDPWLSNNSIQQNIIGSRDFDQVWYDKVVEACQLRIDFMELPSGDKTIVGSQGDSLSGGQKQRLVSPLNENKKKTWTSHRSDHS